MALIDTIRNGGIIPGPLRNVTTAVIPPGGGGGPPIITGTPSACDGLYYANRADIELIYGAENVKKWADLDNDDDATKIGARICWALQNAHAEINDRLLGGPYRVPFVKTSLVPYPRQIITTCGRMAGLMLHDSRGVTDFSENGIPKNQLFNHAQIIKQFFFKILSGTLRLYGQETSKNVPGAFLEPCDDSTRPLPFTF